MNVWAKAYLSNRLDYWTCGPLEPTQTNWNVEQTFHKFEMKILITNHLIINKKERRGWWTIKSRNFVRTAVGNPAKQASKHHFWKWKLPNLNQNIHLWLRRNRWLSVTSPFGVFSWSLISLLEVRISHFTYLWNPFAIAYWGLRFWVLLVVDIMPIIIIIMF